MFGHVVLALSLMFYSSLGGYQTPTTTTVSGQKVTDNAMNPLTGNLVFTVTDGTNTPITYTPQGGSATTATISIPVVNGVVQYVNGFPPTVPNLTTLSPANSFYRIQGQNSGGTVTYYTLPLTNINTASWSFDGYSAPPTTVTAGVLSGIGRPQLACTPGAQYTNLAASDPYNWVCSQLKSDGTIFWTQNPAVAPNNCQKPLMAYVSNRFGAPFCTDSLNAYATSNLVVGTGTTPGAFSLVTASGGGGGGGTVTTFSAGTLPPLFTASVANPTTTPTLSFTASTAIQNGVLAGPASGGSGAYSFRALVAADLPTSIPSSNITYPSNLTVASTSSGGALQQAPYVPAALVTGTVNNTYTFSKGLLLGDSTINYVGASEGAKSVAGVLKQNSPFPIINRGISGALSEGIAAQAWYQCDPTDQTIQNPFLLYEAGINDANSTGGFGGNTPQAIANFTLATTSGILHCAVPWSSQQMSSTAGGTGFTTFTVAALTMNALIPGTMRSSSTSGNTSVYTLPAAPTGYIAYTYGMNDASAATFTATLTSPAGTVNVLNPCTATTTFTTAGCTTIGTNSGYSYATVLISGASTTSANTLTITNTSSAQVIDVMASVIPSSMAGGYTTAAVGVLKQQSDALSASTAAYDTAMQAVVSSLNTAGVTNVFFADVRNGVTAGATWVAARAINTTTDYASGSTTSCLGGVAPLHLNDCGQQAEAYIVQASAAKNGFPLSTTNAGASALGLNNSEIPGTLYMSPVDTPATGFKNFFKTNFKGLQQTAGHMPGVCLYNNNNDALGCNSYVSYEYWTTLGTYLTKITSASYTNFCTSATANNETCQALFTNGAIGNYWATHQFFGAALTSPTNTTTPLGVGIPFSVDSVTGVTGSSGVLNFGVIYMRTGTTAIILPFCKARAANFNGNWWQLYIKDSADTNAITFTANTTTVTDTVNGGATYVTPTNTRNQTIWLAVCSQATATTTNVTMTQISPDNSSPLVKTGVAANTDAAGTGTLTSGTFSYTFTGTYTSAPLCVASDTSAIAATRVQTTTTTLTVTGTATDVINYSCTARN
jgi:hypothetical protein